jgi:choline dehydrogenase-like flavoprotein
MSYIRGNAADFDGWVDEGAPGWSYREMLPCLIMSECNERGDPHYHGYSGPLAVQDSRSMHPLVDHLLEAGARSGYRSNDDFNGTSQMGLGRFQLTQRNGVRCSSASAYLHPARERENLQVFTENLVLRLLLQGGRLSVPQSIATARRKRYFPNGKSSLWPVPMARLKSSCSQVSDRPRNWPGSALPRSSTFRSEPIFRTICCRQ